MRGCLCCCVQGASAASSASSVGGREAEAGSRARALPLAIRWDNLVPSLRRVRGSSSPRAAAGLPWAAKGPWWPRYHAPAPSGWAAPIDYGASAQSQAAAIGFADYGSTLHQHPIWVVRKMCLHTFVCTLGFAVFAALSYVCLASSLYCAGVGGGVALCTFLFRIHFFSERDLGSHKRGNEQLQTNTK